MRPKLNPKNEQEQANRWSNFEWAYLAIIFIIFIDQVSKYLALGRMQVVCNRGAALGIGGNVTFLSVIVLIWILWQIKEERSRLITLALSFILAGGFSNLLDRLTIDCVRDFIHFSFWQSQTRFLPSFNLADSAITLGVILILYKTFTAKVEKLGSF